MRMSIDIVMRHDVSIALGAATAFASIGAIQHYWGKRQRRVWMNGLVCAALIYVGFALRWGNEAWVSIELGGVLLYGALARAGGRWVAAGWALHPAWDLALHLYGPGRAIVPEWYAIACCAYDLVAAAYLVVRGVL